RKSRTRDAHVAWVGRHRRVVEAPPAQVERQLRAAPPAYGNRIQRLRIREGVLFCLSSKSEERKKNENFAGFSLTCGPGALLIATNLRGIVPTAVCPSGISVRVTISD